nr:MAG TPA: hypothetical protein [Caudoviricetes sp.]
MINQRIRSCSIDQLLLREIHSQQNELILSILECHRRRTTPRPLLFIANRLRHACHLHFFILYSFVCWVALTLNTFVSALKDHFHLLSGSFYSGTVHFYCDRKGLYHLSSMFYLVLQNIECRYRHKKGPTKISIKSPGRTKG